MSLIDSTASLISQAASVIWPSPQTKASPTIELSKPWKEEEQRATVLCREALESVANASTDSISPSASSTTASSSSSSSVISLSTSSTTTALSSSSSISSLSTSSIKASTSPVLEEADKLRTVKKSKIDTSRKFSLSDGSTYFGETQGRFPHGKGSRIWKNGDKYQGNFEQGQMEGHGEKTFNAGNSTYGGMFKNGLFHGTGNLVIKMPDHSLRIYKGNFENGILNGDGELTIRYSDGESCTYKGKFTNYQLNGQGEKVHVRILEGKEKEEIVKGFFKNGVCYEVIAPSPTTSRNTSESFLDGIRSTVKNFIGSFFS